MPSKVQNSNRKLVKYLETFENSLFLSQSCLLLNATKFWDGKNRRQGFVGKLKSKKSKKKRVRELVEKYLLLELRQQRCFQQNYWNENSLPRPSSISEQRRASTVMAFSLHNHCSCRLLCRVHIWLTTAPRIETSGTSTARVFALETSSAPCLTFCQSASSLAKQVESVKEHLTRT